MRKQFKMSNVEFTKCSEWDAWEGVRYFWRADIWIDYHMETIATLCRTKKECIAEARAELARLNR